MISEDSERREASGDLETRSDREFAEMMGKFELRQVALNLDEGRAFDGATAEIVQEMRNTGGYPQRFNIVELISISDPDTATTKCVDVECPDLPQRRSCWKSQAVWGTH